MNIAKDFKNDPEINLLEEYKNIYKSNQSEKEMIYNFDELIKACPLNKNSSVSKMEEVNDDVCNYISYDFETFKTPRMIERAVSFIICFLAISLLFSVISTIYSNSKI